MRNISFSLTEPQFLARTKDITRRLGWEMLQPGEELMGCRKVMGRRNGEPLVKLGPIRIISRRREPLGFMDHLPYGLEECRREGFPNLLPHEFIAFFCRTHKGCTPATFITRLEFLYL